MTWFLTLWTVCCTNLTGHSSATNDNCLQTNSDGVQSRSSQLLIVILLLGLTIILDKERILKCLQNLKIKILEFFHNQFKIKLACQWAQNPM